MKALIWVSGSHSSGSISHGGFQVSLSLAKTGRDSGLGYRGWQVRERQGCRSHHRFCQNQHKQESRPYAADVQRDPATHDCHPAVLVPPASPALGPSSGVDFTSSSCTIREQDQDPGLGTNHPCCLPKHLEPRLIP